ncbi:hypothetical protein NONI108955_26195 [Nocardia ninae]
MQQIELGAHQIGVDQAGSGAAEHGDPAPRGRLVRVDAEHEDAHALDLHGTVEFLVVEHRIEAGRGFACGLDHSGLGGHRLGQVDRGGDPARRLQQHLGAVLGQLGRGGGVAGQHHTALMHARGEGFGRVAEDLVAGSGAQRLGVEHIGQLGEVGHERAAAGGVDRAQDGDSGGQEAQQAVVIEHLDPRCQHGGPAGRDGAHRSFDGGGDDDLGPAAQRPVDRVGQAWVARVVTGDQDDIERADPGRQRGDGHDGQARAVAEGGDEQARGARGAAGAGDEDHAAWAQTGQARERVLTDCRRGGPDLSAAGGGRAQGAAGIGRLQRSGIIEVEHRCSSDHRASHLPSSR